MSKSELITAAHLKRKAVIYIRQSTPHQQISNQESLRLQYALSQKAKEFGWQAQDIEVIDNDLGLSAKSTGGREGFKQMLSKVALGEVGIILSYEVTRLCRNCTDWYPLLDICGYKGCLIGDTDGIYDPATANGRILLGLKGQISEYELHTIRTRLKAGLMNKAQRGDLWQLLPTGLERDEQGHVYFDANIEVQKRIKLVFNTFARFQAASKVARFFRSQDLKIPRRDSRGEICWKKAKYRAIINILQNPAYAGAFAYGRTEMFGDGKGLMKNKRRRVEIDQWKVLVLDKYPAYITWETYLANRAKLRDNLAEYQVAKSLGIPREGAALLQGLVYCAKCGYKMTLRYKPSHLYVCCYLQRKEGVSSCQYIAGEPIDIEVTKAFFEALSPIELDVYAKVVEKQKQMEEKILSAHKQQIQRLEYQANLGRRRYERVDPDNRLVAVELERRWEAALRELEDAKQAHRREESKANAPILPLEMKQAFADIGQKLPDLWQKGLLSQEKKKALLRCLIDKVVVDRVVPDQVKVRIVWKGGATTTVFAPMRVGALKNYSGFKQMEEEIFLLTQQNISDEEIAHKLTELGYHSLSSDRVLPKTVENIRYRHRWLRPKGTPRKIDGYLTVSQLAKLLGVAKHWIHDHIRRNKIQITKDQSTGLFLFPDNQTTIECFEKLKSGDVNGITFSNI